MQSPKLGQHFVLTEVCVVVMSVIVQNLCWSHNENPPPGLSHAFTQSYTNELGLLHIVP